MPDEERGVADGAFGGRSTSRDGSAVTATVALRLDRSVARLWMTTYDQLLTRVTRLRTEIRNLNTEASNTTSAITGLTGGGGGTTSASTTTSAAISAATTATQARVTRPRQRTADEGSGITTRNAAEGEGGGGGSILNNPLVQGAAMLAGPYGRAALAAAKILEKVAGVAGKGIAKIDARTDQGYQSSLINDRQSVMYQQMYGISQQQNYNRFRQPLNNYRLGPGGINAMLQQQAVTGLDAQKMAPSVEGIRALTGYGMDTGTVNGMIQNLAAPETNNRLTMTLGTGIYGPGGKQRSPISVIQAIVRGAGLTNANAVKGALQPGSMTRARLSAMGVPEDMQDVVIQYAMANIQFQKKTGGKKGMYNPGDRGDIKTMGIAKNFATEKEVTDTKKELRNEHFYDKQKDNYAAMERNTQKMEDLKMKMEDLTSAIIGARISMRGNPITNFLGSIIPGGGGDPVEKGTTSKGTQTSYGNSGASRAPSNINGKFADRLNRMMADRPGVSVRQGYRSSSDQRTMFLSRYSKTSEKTGVFWENSYWKKNSPGLFDAAPPGMSMHEIGLAADMGYATTADEAWVQVNAAKYGLKTFGNVNNEKHHIQPLELANSRRQYEKDGAPWGTGPTGAAKFPYDATFEGGSEPHGGSSSSSSGGGGAIQVNSQMSMAESIALDRASNRMKIGGGGAGGRMVTLRSVFTPSAGNGKSPTAGTAPTSKTIPKGFKYRTTPSYDGWGYFVPQSFSDADLEQLHLHEQKDWTRTVKNSDGVLMGGFAMNQYNWNRGGGLAFAKNPALATPEDQKKVAKVLLDELHAHNGFESIVRGNISWPGAGKLKSIDLPPGTPTSTTYGPKGDPVEGPSRRGGNTTVVVEGGGGGITIAPNIYVQSTGNNTADANRIAQEIADIVARRVKTTALRSR